MGGYSGKTSAKNNKYGKSVKNTKRKNGIDQPIGFFQEKLNKASYLIKQIESCIETAETSNRSIVVVSKLSEVTGHMTELGKLEKLGFYKGKPKVSDYFLAFQNRKDMILKDGLERALKSGETKDTILESKEFFTDEILKFVDKL